MWHHSGEAGPLIERNKAGFDAVAAVAGIDALGRVIGIKLASKSIKEDDFADLLRQVHNYYNGNKSYVFLDNLHLHHSKKIASLALLLNIELLFNAPVSSHLNPIERLWAHSKRIFRLALLHI